MQDLDHIRRLIISFTFFWFFSVGFYWGLRDGKIFGFYGWPPYYDRGTHPWNYRVAVLMWLLSALGCFVTLVIELGKLLT